MADDATYFLTRAHQEVGAAKKACSSAARQAHLELAHRYRDLAAAIEAQDAKVTAVREQILQMRSSRSRGTAL